MPSNIQNRTIFCHDNLDVLRSINSDSIDLIYLDPPFNKKKEFTAPIGSSAEGAGFSDIFREEDVKDDWLQSIREDAIELYELLEFAKRAEGRRSYNFCYLAYMAIRLLEMHRILKSTGSLFLHCDPTMSHYLKLAMDCIFGEKNFRNEIVWCYTGPGSPKMRQFNRKHDIIFWYNKGDTWCFNGDSVRLPYKDPMQRPRKAFDTGNAFAQEEIDKMRSRGKIPETWWTDIAIAVRSKKENTGYPTQKPKKLLERIIKAGSNKGDIVLDPFCGCATTCVAAEALGRQWVGIDVSVEAYNLVKLRLKKEVAAADNLFDWNKEIEFTTSPPQRSDQGTEGRIQKWIYVISNPQFHGDYKVGVASNWKSRLNSYQTSDPNRKYKLEYKKLSPYFREIEKYIHNKFENNHEWVRAELEDIIQEIENYKYSYELEKQDDLFAAEE